MAKFGKTNTHIVSKPKRTRQGNSGNTKRGNKGGGPGGSTKSKMYKKRYRGQGK